MAYNPSGVGVVVGSWHLHTFNNSSCSPFYRTQFDKFLLTVPKIANIIILEQLFGIVIMKGD